LDTVSDEFQENSGSDQLVDINEEVRLEAVSNYKVLLGCVGK